MRRFTLRPLLLVAAVLLSDHLAKEWVRTSFVIGSRTPVAGELLFLAPSRNPGTALGLFVEHPDPVAIVTSALVIALLIALVARIVRRPLAVAGVGLLAGGAVANLVDRLAHGGVLDFFDLGVGTLRIPTFNTADMAISVGFLLALLDAFRTRIDPD